MPRTTTSGVASLVAGRAVRVAREETGVSQAALAERLGVSAPYVSGIERGRMNPTVGRLSSIADALGVEFDVVFRIPEPVVEPDIPTPPAVAAKI
jgi:transcriptional regulator with XRE-family HTH domain